VMDSTGASQRPLTRDTFEDWAPAWTPEGRRILFVRRANVVRSPTARYRIWIINRDGSGLQALTAATGTSDDAEPAATPPGNASDRSFSSTLARAPQTPFGPATSHCVYGTVAGESLVDSDATPKNCMYGNDGNDTMWGNAGNDSVYGQNGADTIYGGTGNDRVLGGAGNDKVYGGSHVDRVFGDTGADLVEGGTGNDPEIRGGLQADTQNGNDGDDTLFSKGDGSTDTINGGFGADHAYADSGDPVTSATRH